MPNKWIEHVKQYANDNNISYDCALTCPNFIKGLYSSCKIM